MEAHDVFVVFTGLISARRHVNHAKWDFSRAEDVWIPGVSTTHTY
jgi:hypothetical protein